jgi:acetyl esterase/lipase
MKSIGLTLFFFCTVLLPMLGQIKEIPLYPAGKEIPLSRACAEVEKMDTAKGGIPGRFSKVQTPRLVFFPAKPANSPKAKSKAHAKSPKPLISKAPALLVVPGGGYSFVSYENEGRQMGERFSAEGFDVYVLVYRLPLPECQTESKWVPLTDAMTASEYLRGLGYNHLFVLGFSAGGHLASSLLTLADRNPWHTPVPQPTAACLVYPVIDMDHYQHTGSRRKLLGADTNSAWQSLFSTQKQVKAGVAPTILIHASDDKAVAWQNALLFTEALQQVGTKAELHLFPEGGHGFGIGPANRKVAPDWVPLTVRFFKKFIQTTP